MMPPMPPVPPAAPMPAMPVDGMACPHCAKPVMLQKSPMGDKPGMSPMADKDAHSKSAPKSDKPMKSDKKDAPKAKKHNAASAPMDELKEVLKAGKPDGNE